MSAGETEPDLTFQWPAETGFPFVLFFCVVGSLLAHGATFVLFQVVYPERVTIPHPAPRVSLLTPSSPENLALLRWIEAEDPALIASEAAIRPPALVEVRYRPSFAEARTVPLGAPEEASRQVRFPPAPDHLALRPNAVPPAPAPGASPAPSRFRFSGVLARRPLAQNPSFQFPGQAPSPVQPSVFLVGVTAEGAVGFHFLQESSGNPDLDAMGARQLLKLRFAPSDAPVTWGHAAVVWSRDAYLAETAP